MKRLVLVSLAVLAELLWLGDARAASSDGPDGGTVAPKATASSPEAIRQVFRSPQFQFCHERDYPLTQGEKEWCNLGAADNKQACPSLREACSNAATAKQLEVREPFSITLPEIGLPIRLLLWILLGVALAVLIFALVRHFLDHKPKAAVVRTAAAAAGDDDAAAAAARQVETDVQRLLDRARAAAATGDFRVAIGDTYAALLRRLEGSRLVHVEPDQTNGDYLRKVRKDRPDVAGRMAEVVDSVESAQFGQTTPTRDAFERVWARVAGLLAERLGPTLLILWLLSASACFQPRSDWEHSPSGRAGVIEYLGKRGFEVHERLLTVAKIADSKADQLVLLPGARLSVGDWKAVKGWVVAGNGLVIAGGARSLPGWIGAHIVEKGGKGEPVKPTALADKRLGTSSIRVPEANSVEPGNGATTLLARKEGAYAVERVVEHVASPDADNDNGAAEDGEAENDNGDEEQEEAQGEDAVPRVLVLADDFLFRNASLLVGDNAVVLERLLRDRGARIELVGDLTGLVSSNPVESVKRGRLGPALLQLAAFLVLFFVCRGARFGRPLESRIVARREFAEHVRALGLHYARARAERHALACLGTYAVERLRERCGAEVDRSLSALADAVAKRTGRSVGDVMRIFIEARDAKAGEPADKGARDLDTARELCKLLEETGGTGGHRRIQSNV